MLARPELPKKTTLTDKFIEKLPLAGEPGSPPGKSEYIVRDDLQPGFYLLVGRRVKTWMAVADGVREGRRRTLKIAIGRVGDPGLTTDKARKKAKAHISAVQAGSRDPAKRQRKARTLASAWTEYRAHLETLGRSPATIKFYADHVRLSLAPLANRSLSDLSSDREGIRRWFARATREHGKGGANGAARTLSTVFNYCANKLDDVGLTYNPIKALTLHKLGKSAERLTPEDLPRWGAQLAAMENRVRAELHTFLALSGSRPEVITRARIEHIDWKRRVLTLIRPKGKETGEIPLSRAMLRCLCRAIRAGRIEASGSPWLFPSALSKSGHVQEIKENRATLFAYGKDCRKLYRTIAFTLGIPETHSRALMLHAQSSDGAHNTYLMTRGLATSLHEAQARMSAAIVAAIFPEGEPRSSRSVEMRQRRMGPRPGTPRPARTLPAAEPQPATQATAD